MEVELGNRRVRGVVTALRGPSDVSALKPVLGVAGRVPVSLLDLAEWIAATYASTLARALALVTPSDAEARPPEPWVRVLSGEGATARQAEILAHAECRIPERGNGMVPEDFDVCVFEVSVRRFAFTAQKQFVEILADPDAAVP